MYQKINKIGNEEDTTVIKRIKDNTFIPFDPANKDYQQYLAWLAEDNEPLPADEPETTE